MALLLNNLGTFSTIEQVWAEHPEGGREGDYVVVGSSTYYWDKYSRCWVQSSATPSGGGGSRVVDGDLTVTGDLGVGGDAVINGKLIVNGVEIDPNNMSGGSGSGSSTGQLVYKSIVFKRSVTRPDTPQDGAFGNPVPNGWYDSVPQGTDPIWMSSRYFTSDNQRPAGVNNDNWNIWSAPALMSDTEDFDVEFSNAATTNVPTAPPESESDRAAAGWFDPVRDPSANWSQMNWMATRTRFVNDSGNLTWTGWKIMLIKGEHGEPGNPGSNGDGFRSVYAKAASNVTPTITSQGYPPTGNVTWKTSVAALTLNAGDVLWMAEKRCTGGVWGNWSTPIRISGTNGTPGNPGADGADIEFIYKRSNSLPGSSDTAPVSVDEDDAVPTSEGWSDNPQGVDPTHKYEWMCQRTKPAGINQSWGPWIGPFVWSAYGDQGMDGDGLEYIFRHIKANQSLSSVIANPCYQYTTANPNNPSQAQMHIVDNYRGGVYLDNGVWYPEGWDGSLGIFSGWSGGVFNGSGEWIPAGWSDNPQGVDSEWTKEYMSIRKRHNGVWGDWSTPALWAMYSAEHTVSIDSEGYWCIDGQRVLVDGQPVSAEGKDGTGVRIKGSRDYLTAAQATANSAGISNPTSLEGLDLTGVTVGDCYVVDYVDYNAGEWTRGHLYVYNGSSGSSWSDKWTDLGVFRGEPGQSQYMHIAWATDVDTSGTAPVLPTGASWSKVNDTGDYDWMGICVDDKPNDPDSFTDYEWNYIKGVDGADIEFVYILTKNNSNPGVETGQTDHNGHTNAQAEFLPCALAANVSASQPKAKAAANGRYEYTDDPESVTSEYRYCWMSKRKKNANGTWDAWSTPALWATYAEGQTWVDTGGVNQIVVNCNNTGKAKSALNMTLDCYLRYGSELCTLDEQANSATFGGAGGTVTPSFDPQAMDDEFEFDFDIAANASVTAGAITIELTGHDRSGVLRTAKKQIPVIVNRDGASGAQGPMLRFRGVWNSTDTYVWNDTFRDAVKHNGSFWMVGVQGSSLHDQDGPGETQDQGDWIDMGNARFFATELLLAENAAIDLLSSNVINLFNSSGDKVASINADGQGNYVIYYPYNETLGKQNKRMEDSYDGWRYYYNDDADNTIQWMLGPGGTIIKTVSVSMSPIQLSTTTVRRLDYNLDGNDPELTMATRYIYANDQSTNNGKVYDSAGINNNEPAGTVIPDGTYATAAYPLQDVSDMNNVTYYLPVVVINGGKITRRYEFRIQSN